MPGFATLVPMSKRKPKKRNFKYGNGPLGSVRQPVAASKPASSKQENSIVPAGQFSYVAKDVKRIAILALGFVSLQVGLWYLINHTFIGDKIYGLIQL